MVHVSIKNDTCIFLWDFCLEACLYKFISKCANFRAEFTKPLH